MLVLFACVQVVEHVAKAAERPPIILQPLQEDVNFSSHTCAAMLETLNELQGTATGTAGYRSL